MGPVAMPRSRPRVRFLASHLLLRDAPSFPYDITVKTCLEDVARAFGPWSLRPSLASGPCHSALGTPHIVAVSPHSSEPLSSPGTP